MIATMKHHILILGLVLNLFSTRFTHGDSTHPGSIEEEVKAIKDEYWQQHRMAIEALQHAKSREEGMKLYIEKRPSPARCVERLLALARTDPKSPGGFEALVAAIGFVDTAWNWKDEPVRRGDVVDLLLNNHVENPRIGETFRSLVDLDIDSSTEILRQAAKRNPIREVRGQAVFYLAKNRALFECWDFPM